MPNQNSAKVPIRTIRRNEIRANASIFSSDNGAGSDSARVVAQAAAASTSNAFPAADSIWPASTPIALKDRKAIKVSIRRQTSALKNDSVKIGAAGAELLGPKPDNSDLFPHRFAETPAASPLLSFEAITNAKMALQLANNTSLSTPSPSTPTAPPNQPEEPLVRWPPRPSLLKTFFPVLEESQFCISCQQQLWHVWMHGCLRQSSAIRRSTEDPSQLLLAHAGLVPSLFLSDELPPLPSTDFILPQRINIYAPSPELPETVTPHTFQTLSATQQSDLHALRSALWDSQRALSHWTHQVSRVEKSLKEAKKRSKVAEEWLCKKMECWEKSWMACGMGIAALASWGANAYLERKQLDRTREASYQLAPDLSSEIATNLAQIATEESLLTSLESKLLKLRARKSQLEEDEQGDPELLERVERIAKDVDVRGEACKACGDQLEAIMESKRMKEEELKRARENLETLSNQLQSTLLRQRNLESQLVQLTTTSTTLDNELSNLQLESNEANTRLQSFRLESRTLSTQLASDLENANGALSSLRMEFNALNSQLASLRSQKDKLSRTLEDEQLKLSESKARESEVLKSINLERTAWKSEDSKLQSDLDSARQKLSKAQREVAELERSKSETVEKLDSLTKKKEHTELEIETWKRKMLEDRMKSEELVGKAREGLEEAEKKRKEMVERSNVLVVETGERKRELAEIEASWATERKELQKHAQESRASIDQAEAETAKLESELPGWIQRRDELEKVFETLSEERNEMQGKKEELIRVLDEQKGKIEDAERVKEAKVVGLAERQKTADEAIRIHEQVMLESKQHKAEAERRQKELKAKIALVDKHLGQAKTVANKIESESALLKQREVQVEQETGKLILELEKLMGHLESVEGQCRKSREVDLARATEQSDRYRDLLARSEHEFEQLLTALTLENQEQELSDHENPDLFATVKSLQDRVGAIYQQNKAGLGFAASMGWKGLNDLLFVQF